MENEFTIPSTATPSSICISYQFCIHTDQSRVKRDNGMIWDCDTLFEVTDWYNLKNARKIERINRAYGKDFEIYMHYPDGKIQLIRTILPIEILP